MGINDIVMMHEKRTVCTRITYIARTNGILVPTDATAAADRHRTPTQKNRLSAQASSAAAATAAARHSKGPYREVSELLAHTVLAACCVHSQL